MEATILVADDDPEIAELMTLYLGKEGMKVKAAYDGTTTLTELETETPDLLILDIMLPGPDGFEICSTLRENGLHLPVIILTARDEESDRVLGLELGADDYVTKPFSPRELAARVKANLRRTFDKQNGEPNNGGPLTVCGNLSIDLEAMKLTCDGHTIDVTPKEFDLLVTLIQHPGRVYTREQLLTQVWGYDYFGSDRTVDTHIKRIRQKLGPPYRDAIKTVWGVGYKFEDEPFE